MANALEAAGIPHEAAHQRAAQNPEETRKRAEKRALSALIVDAIATQEAIAISDDELAERIAALVTGSAGRQRERLAQFYREDDHRETLRQVMRREKTLDQLLQRARGEAEADGHGPAADADASK
jgi:FKBP-type peptidyl-prolyl cis-trans isomerase (trigger factor)